jgi:hypothetical protein
MARFAGGWTTTGAGSTTLPIAGLTAATATRPYVVEIGVFNTTAVAVAIAIRRITALGTAGAAQTEIYEDDPAKTAVATLLDTWTGAPTFVAGNIRVGRLGAAVGSGVIFTFGGRGLPIPSSTGDGVVIVPLVGTGQICDVYFSWDE